MKISFNFEKTLDFLYLITTTIVFIFNFNTDIFIIFPGYIWGNILIVCFFAFVTFALNNRGYKLYWNTAFTLAILFVLICLVSVTYSYSPNDSIKKTSTMAIVVLLAISIYQYIVIFDKLDYVLNCFAFSGTCMALYLFYMSGFKFGDRLGAAIGDANLTGITMSFAATIALFKYLKSHKLGFLLELIILIISILLTGSRTAVAILFSTIIVLVYGYVLINHGPFRKLIIATIALIVLGIILWKLIMNNELLYNIIGIRFVSLFQILSGKRSIINESSAQNRKYLADVAYKWFEESPIFGHGINSFSLYNQNVISGKFEFCHRNYSELLCSVGLVGFVVYYSIFAIIGIRAFRNKNIHVVGYKILVISLLFQYLIGDYGLVVYYEKNTWVLIAIMLAIVNYLKKSSDVESEVYNE